MDWCRDLTVFLLLISQPDSLLPEMQQAPEPLPDGWSIGDFDGDESLGSGGKADREILETLFGSAFDTPTYQFRVYRV